MEKKEKDDGPALTTSMFSGIVKEDAVGEKAPYFLQDNDMAISTISMAAECFWSPDTTIAGLADCVHQLCTDRDYSNFLLFVDHSQLEFFACCGDSQRAAKLRADDYCILMIDQGDCFDHEGDGDETTCRERNICSSLATRKLQQAVSSYVEATAEYLHDTWQNQGLIPVALLKAKCKELLRILADLSQCEHWLVLAGSDEMQTRGYRNAKHINVFQADKSGFRIAAYHSNPSFVQG